MDPMPIQPYKDPGDFPIYHRMSMEFGMRLPVIPIAPIVPCLNCGETLKNWKIGMVYCDDECEQAFRFRMEIGFQEPS